MEVENKNYIKGIIGGLIGGLIASLPWIICYVYLEMLWSLLALPIAWGALKGYQLLKGKEDKKLPIIITVISIVVITLVTLVIIPLLLLAQEGLTPDFETLKLLYEFEQFKSAIIKDYIFSLLFTILGISGAVSNIKSQIEGNTKNVKLSSINTVNKEQINQMKEIFVKNGAMDKDNAVDKKIILEEFNNSLVFNTLTMQQIIRKYKGKYYFSEKAENSFLYRFLLLYGKIMLFVLIITLITIFIISL